MRNRVVFASVCTLGLLLQPLAAQYRNAVPGYTFEFPRDYFDHPNFQTEWWYYTGNLRSGNGRQFGFELTFFRQAVSRELTAPTPWDVRDLYVAHFALSDLDGQHFYHSERLNRAGPGVAGASGSSGRIWNGNWRVQLQNSDQELDAIETDFQIHLKLHSEKPPVIHGENGVSQKAAAAGHASYYVSLTRLEANGEIGMNSQKFSVSGLAWMDHEFFTQQLETGRTGWDWVSIQLNDNTELMLFRIRRKEGSVDAFSSGTYVDAKGKSTHLRAADFNFQPLADSWTSPKTRATYPISWKIAVPKLALDLEVHTKLAGQELATSAAFVPAYWEGAVSLRGQRGSDPCAGVGYLEMTGYDRPVQLNP